MSEYFNISDISVSNYFNSTTVSKFIPYNDKTLEFSAYHFHHNRVPFIILFVKDNEGTGGKANIYIERIDSHTCRKGITMEVVMPFDVMKQNPNLKKFYDMSVMLVNTENNVYYDTKGIETRDMVPTCDESEYDEYQKTYRHWCISCDTVWKNMRVSQSDSSDSFNPNCYFKINPFNYNYISDTEEKISDFMKKINAFVKYDGGVPRLIESAIVANYDRKAS
jgi:hypothetical protein